MAGETELSALPIHSSEPDSSSRTEVPHDVAKIDIHEEEPAVSGNEDKPLLDEHNFKVEGDVRGPEEGTWRELLSELWIQAVMAFPLSGNMICLSVMNMITLSFVGKFGTEALAAAALGQSIVFMFGRLPMVGMSCALDTLASQAFGAGQRDALALIFQRTIAFLMAHGVGFTLIILAVPSLLEKCGYDHSLCLLVGSFSRAMLPSIFIDAINRPMNRILVAQRITQPQAWIQVLVTAAHFGINYLFVVVLKGPFQMTAWAYTLSTLFSCLVFAAYFALFNKGYCTWGSGLTLQAFKEWRSYAKLAYPAGFMQCAESWCWGSMNILAGFLPNPESSVAALSIAFTLFTSMYFVYLSQALACSTRVGNLIGAGNAKGARTAMIAARFSVPPTWLVSAFLFSEPHIRNWLIGIFTDGSDQTLVTIIERLLWLMVGLNLVDGIQTVMSGVIQGLGRQDFGLRVNIVAFYLIAIPVACLFGYAFKFGVEGLYTGLIFGASAQAIAFVWFSQRVNWIEEAEKAMVRVKALERDSTSEAVGDRAQESAERDASPLV